MSMLDKIFKKNHSEVHMPVPGEMREDYQRYMERKNVQVQPTPETSTMEARQEVNLSSFDLFSNPIPSAPMPEPVAPLQTIHNEPAPMVHMDQPVTLETINERLSSLERILKERGYI